MTLGQLKPLLQLPPLDIRRLLADPLRRPGLADTEELSDTEAALLCLADFCVTYFCLPDGSVYDLLRNIWPELKEHYADDAVDNWDRPYHVGVADRRYVAWPGRSTLFDLVTLETVAELPGRMAHLNTVDVTEYFHRARVALQRRTSKKG